MRYYDEYKGLYELQHFIISTSWFKVPLQIGKHVLSDVRYVRRLAMPLRRKIYWCWYSACRNFSRYVGGLLGGRYHTYSHRKQEYLDRHISQQYKQRNA